MTLLLDLVLSRGELEGSRADKAELRLKEEVLSKGEAKKDLAPLEETVAPQFGLINAALGCRVRPASGWVNEQCCDRAGLACDRAETSHWVRRRTESDMTCSASSESN